MNKQELLIRIGQLCKFVMDETDPDKLAEYLSELQALVEIYRNRVDARAPPASLARKLARFIHRR